MNQDEAMLFEEIQCCQTDEDIWSLVDSQCLDIIGTSDQDQVKLAHKQLFKVIKLFRRFLQSQNWYQEDYKQKQQLEALQLNCKSLDMEISKLNKQVRLFQGEQEELKSLSFEHLKQTEEMLFTTLKSISEIKNTIAASKLCVICLHQPYNMMIEECGHICVCEDCSYRITLCPIDRNRIVSLKKVYLS